MVYKSILPFFLDHSADFFYGVEDKVLHWKDATYIPCGGIYTLEKIIATTPDRNWDICSIQEDTTHAFVVVSASGPLPGFHGLFVREDYVIPRSGKITVVDWGKERITDIEFCRAVNDIYGMAGDTFEYENQSIFELTETQQMKEVYLAYDGCPVATNYKGWMGKINGQFITAMEQNGSSEYICQAIPQQYIPILERYSSSILSYS